MKYSGPPNDCVRCDKSVMCSTLIITRGHLQGNMRVLTRDIFKVLIIIGNVQIKMNFQEFSMMLKAIKEMELCIHYVCYC